MLSENPLYFLLVLDLDGGMLTAQFGLTTFSGHAHGPDLLACELVDAIVARRRPYLPQLPLRDEYLASLGAAKDYASRRCVGGRPACSRSHGKTTTPLVIQERSARVLNAAGRLAVVPKTFHQPLSEDCPNLSATVTRELEEELFGRQELDQLSSEARGLRAPGMTRWLHYPCAGFATTRAH